MPFPFPFPGPAGDISGGPVVSEGKAGTQHIWSRICPVSKSHFFHLPHSSVSQTNESSQTSPSQTVTSTTGVTQDRCFMQAEKENKGTVAKISQDYRGGWSQRGLLPAELLEAQMCCCCVFIISETWVGSIQCSQSSSHEIIIEINNV